MKPGAERLAARLRKQADAIPRRRLGGRPIGAWRVTNGRFPPIVYLPFSGLFIWNGLSFDLSLTATFSYGACLLGINKAISVKSNIPNRQIIPNRLRFIHNTGIAIVVIISAAVIR